jgi:hypothetical protein
MGVGLLTNISFGSLIKVISRSLCASGHIFFEADGLQGLVDFDGLNVGLAHRLYRVCAWLILHNDTLRHKDG